MLYTLAECNPGQFSCDEKFKPTETNGNYESAYSSFNEVISGYVGKCWDNSYLCDGVQDCKDGFDEDDCSMSIVISISIIIDNDA